MRKGSFFLANSAPLRTLRDITRDLQEIFLQYEEKLLSLQKFFTRVKPFITYHSVKTPDISVLGGR